MTMRLRITKKRAIKECKELWEAIEASGKPKDAFFRSLDGQRWRGKYSYDCPLCEYAGQFPGLGCFHCPLWTKYRIFCAFLGFSSRLAPSKKWIKAIRNL